MRSERLTRALNLADQIDGLGFEHIAKDLRGEALARADRESLMIFGKGEIKLIYSFPFKSKFKNKERGMNPDTP